MVWLWLELELFGCSEMVEVRLRELDDKLETMGESAKTGEGKVPSTPDEKAI